MAITGLDAALAGMMPPYSFLKVGGTMEAAGVEHSLFYTSGYPGAAVAPSPGINGAALTTYAGQLPFTNPASGNSYLCRLSSRATLVGTLRLLDRLWHNSGLVVTTTTAQSITFPGLPSRCVPASGTTPDANGGRIMAAIEVSTATTNAGAVTNTTMSYTDQDGNAGATATIGSFPATAVAGTFVPFQLAAGDTGIRSIESVTLGTSYAAGAIHIVMYREIARLGLTQPNVDAAVDAMTSGFPRFYDSSVPFLTWTPNATTAATIAGMFGVTQG